MQTILYIHGLSSSGTSKTTKSLGSLLPDVRIVAPDMPLDPDEALNLLFNLTSEHRPDLVIGTSMGGMFAQKLRGFKKILINPALHVSRFMRDCIGVHPFMNPRRDGEDTFEITNELCDAYHELEKKQYVGLDAFERENTYALFGEKDTTVNDREEYLIYYKHYKMFPGEHRLTFQDIKYHLVPLIREILIS